VNKIIFVYKQQFTSLFRQSELKDGRKKKEEGRRRKRKEEEVRKKKKEEEGRDRNRPPSCRLSWPPAAIYAKPTSRHTKCGLAASRPRKIID